MRLQNIDIKKLNWEKVGGLLPAVIQDVSTLQILMLGYMNIDALQETIKTKKVTFYSRTKNRLWVKGETSGNFLTLIDMSYDCDQDALLLSVQPNGMTCHLDTVSCFNGIENEFSMLTKLEATIKDRYEHRPHLSYITSLFNAGVKRIAQKVGEEGVEVALAGVSESKDDVISEAADLLFHLMVLLKERDIKLADVCRELNKRCTLRNRTT